MNYEADKASAPTAAPTLASAFKRLAAIAGVRDDEGLLARMPPSTGQERADFTAALAACGRLLAPLSKSQSLLGRFLRDECFDGGEVSPRYLPKEAQKALKKGDAVASADADVWIMIDNKDGSVQVSHAHPESFEVLGESIVEWLMVEADALEAASKPKKSKSAQIAEGKPAIDAALTSLAALCGAKDDVAKKLAALKHSNRDTRWKYFLQALKACGQPWSPKVLAAFKGRLFGRCLTGSMHDGDEAVEVDDKDDDLDGINPVYIRRYPKPAQKPMKLVKPTNFVASKGPEVWFVLWEVQGNCSSWPITLHHAAYDGYEMLGTLESWLAAEVARAQDFTRASSPPGTA